jgi:hypothetical protein
MPGVRLPLADRKEISLGLRGRETLLAISRQVAGNGGRPHSGRRGYTRASVATAASQFI